MQSFPPGLRIAQSVPTLAGADGLAGINTTLFSPNAIVAVTENNSLYMLRKASVAAASSPDIIAPVDGSPGRWFLYSQGAQDFQNVALVVPSMPPNSGANVDATVLGADDGDVVLFNLRQSGVPTELAITSPYIASPNSVTFKVLNGTGSTVSGGTYTLRVAVLQSP